MTSLDILYYCLATGFLILVAIMGYVAYYIVGVLKSAQLLIDKSVETVNSVQDFKDKLNSDFIKGAAMSGVSFLGAKLMERFTGKKKK